MLNKNPERYKRQKTKLCRKGEEIQHILEKIKNLFMKEIQHLNEIGKKINITMNKKVNK